MSGDTDHTEESRDANGSILKFIFKYLFILKAAADGWTVKYLGENTFQFLGPRRKRTLSSSQFIEKYSK